LLRHAHRPRFVELVVGNTVASRDRLDKTIREIEDQEAEEAALTSDIKVASMREKKNGQLLFADRAGKLAALAASGRRIINDMNKISRAA
jgi:hypothetical protein